MQIVVIVVNSHCQIISCNNMLEFYDSSIMSDNSKNLLYTDWSEGPGKKSHEIKHVMYKMLPNKLTNSINQQLNIFLLSE